MTTTERARLARQNRAAQLLTSAECEFNRAVVALPAALAALGAAPNLTNLYSLAARDRDALAAPLVRLERAGLGLSGVARAWAATIDTLDADMRTIADAYLDLGAWAKKTAAHFLRAVAWQELPTTREHVAEDALQSVPVDAGAEPWAELFALVAEARRAGDALAADTKLDCRGLLRGHEIDMTSLRAAGPAGATLAARADFECRHALAELRRLAAPDLY